MQANLTRCLLLLAFCLAIITRPAPVSAQDDVARAIILGENVEFTINRGNEAADFETISVKVGAKLLKQFAVPNGGFLNVVATFNGHEADYLLLRTSMGQGACAGGDLYALKFYTYGDEQPPKISLQVSPVLTTCLGEWPPLKFTYGLKGDLVISVSGHELRGDVWSRWVPERKTTAPSKKR